MENGALKNSNLYPVTFRHRINFQKSWLNLSSDRKSLDKDTTQFGQIKNCYYLISLLLLLGIFNAPQAIAQNPVPKKGQVFKDEVVPRIFISIDPDSLDQLIVLGSQGDNHHYLSTMIFDNGEVIDTVERIGFRLRGNTSRGAQKKSFKISFNTYEPSRKFYGLEKLNINGEHNDPSIIRSKMCWDMLRAMGIPAPRANHVQLYINNQYAGIYINVEHIDEEFVDSRFGNQDGNLYKCTWPVTLEYEGDDPAHYKQEMWGKRPYELKTNLETDDYSDLAAFIDVLNNTTFADFECELEKVFNVDAYLKVMAFDILTSNWDGPIFNKNNFYLYHNQATGKFEYIPFDLDNTFGIDWFIGDLATRDIYNWKPTGESRPIYTRLLNYAPYRQRFSFYMQQLLEEVFNPTILHPYLDSLKENVDEFVRSDPFRSRDYGWNLADYDASYEEAIGQHVEYGLKPYITERYASALQQLNLENIVPIIQNIKTPLALTNVPLTFSAEAVDDGAISSLQFCFAIGDSPNVSCNLMSQIEGSNNYTFTIPTVSEATDIHYFITAFDNTDLENSYPTCGTQSISLKANSLSLYINEIQARNTTTLGDEAAEFDDWIELYNGGEERINLSTFFLTDNENRPDKWQLPDVIIEPKSYLLIWADEDQEQGELHSNFKLSGSGEFIGLFEQVAGDLVPVDGFNFGEQLEDKSYGRIPDGVGELQEMTPTPNATNGFTSPTYELPKSAIKIYPNPSTNQVTIAINHPTFSNLSVRGINLLGQLVFAEEVKDHQLDWDMRNLPNGTYFIQIQEEGQLIGVEKILLVNHE